MVRNALCLSYLSVNRTNVTKGRHQAIVTPERAPSLLYCGVTASACASSGVIV